MKSYLIVCLMIFFSFMGWSNQLQSLEDTICVNLDNAKKPPLKKFRTTHKVVSSDSIKLDGLADLPLSASSQFSEEELSKIIDLLPSAPSTIMVIDLREESHGFINGSPVSWVKGEYGEYNDANVGKSLAEIESDEKNRLKQASQEGTINVIIKKDSTFQQLNVEKILTERELIESKGLKYVRLPVTDHHRPSDQAVDEFIRLVLSLPDSTWLHFHCRGGSGRTTTFLSMYDMMFNSDKVSVEDILGRQKLIGGKDLANLDQDPTDYKYKPSIERLEFLHNFYKYCNQVPDFSVSWSQWILLQQSKS